MLLSYEGNKELPRHPTIGRPRQFLLSAGAVITALAHQLRQLATGKYWRQGARTSALGARHEQARLRSNKTHYGPTDPDTRISIKPGKVPALNYLYSFTVDTAHGVISHMQADYADSRDSRHLPRLLTGLQHRLRAYKLCLRDLLADAGYANGSNYARRRPAAWDLGRRNTASSAASCFPLPALTARLLFGTFHQTPNSRLMN